ncbi:MAG: hypothetical protein ACKVU1_04810 [bacterium]
MTAAKVSRDPIETAAFLILLAGVFFLAIHDLSILFFPHDLIYGEGFVLRDAAMLKAGKSPYTPVGATLGVVANYPPVYPLVTALAMIPFGTGFFAGRLISILATAGCAYFIWRLARRGAAPDAGAVLGGARAAVFAPLFFLADVVVYYWSPYARVDMLALALELAALDAFAAVVLANEADAGSVRRALARGIVLAILAVFTRPTALAAPAALIAACVLGRRARISAIAAGCLAAGAALVAFLLNALTSGEFLRHTIAYNANAFRWGEITSLLLDFVTPHAPLFVIAAAFFVLVPGGACRRLLGCYFAAACVLALLVGKVGSSANYFLQAVAAASVLAGVAIARSEGVARRVLWVAACAGPILFATVPFSRTLELRMNPFPAMGRTPGDDDRRAGNDVMGLVRQTQGEILIEDAGFLVRAGKTVWAAPLQLSYLEEQGLYDSAPLAAKIRRREFAAIILSYNFVSPAVRAAIGEAYRPERVIEIPRRYKYVVLRPAPAG